ncbi:MAG: hypothetical protein NXH75_01655 [Halobacteriovoraceae bacterium]|nr:hypothetical protein [Halobacteriovoraceae bacterium]
MIENLHQDIYDNVDFMAMDKFQNLIQSTVTRAVIANDDNPDVTSVSFKFQQFLEGLGQFVNSKGKENALQVGTDTILAVTNALQFDLDDSEAFLLYHIRALGKFRKKESELLSELKKQWNKYPDYAMEDREFSRALKGLMREKFIQYRKGNIHLNPSFVIRYRD